MTEKEAIKLLQYTCDFGEHTSIVKEALSMARNALEKQIAKKPKDIGWLYCQSCGKKLDVCEQKNYCGDCGQAIDWSDEDIYSKISSFIPVE